MAAVPSPLSSFSLRTAEAGDFDAYMDAFEVVATEGRWMGAEAPIDRVARRPAFDRAVAGDASVVFLADAGLDGGSGIIGAIYASLGGGVVDLGMFVGGDHRGGGVGSALLEAVIDWARHHGAHKISLAAWPTNHPAIGLYARYGFRVEGTRRRHYRRRSGALWDSVVMGLILDESSAGGPGPSSERPPIVVPDIGLGRDRLLLRPWSHTDIPILVALIDDPEVHRWLDRVPHPYGLTDAEEFIAGTRVSLTAGTALPLAIVVDGALVGSIDLKIDALDDRTAETGYWVAAAARGRGVASTAARFLSDYGIETLGLRRVELNAAVANTASRRVAEKAGFEFEGVRRAWRTVGGVPSDFATYSRVAVPD